MEWFACNHFSCAKSESVRQQNGGEGSRKEGMFYLDKDKEEYYSKAFDSLLSLL